jgi:hypothetical protein
MNDLLSHLIEMLPEQDPAEPDPITMILLEILQDLMRRDYNHDRLDERVSALEDSFHRRWGK